MEILLVLIPLAIVFAVVGVFIFIRSANAGQFDDLETPAHRIFLDEIEGDKKEC